MLHEETRIRWQALDLTFCYPEFSGELRVRLRSLRLVPFGAFQCRWMRKINLPFFPSGS